MLQSPVSYQGGKQRLAGQILDHVAVCPGETFYDVCCGSGAVSIELFNRGHTGKLVLIDAGPWGLFWQAVALGRFDLSVFRRYIDAIPANVGAIQAHIKELSTHPVDEDAPYVFVLLQASSFGGKAIWTAKGRWQNTSFRSYWLPTATSSRRSPVNPMMPMPETLFERVRVCVERLSGRIEAHHRDAEDFPFEAGIVYVDPPYKGTTKYGHELDLDRCIKAGLKGYCRVYVSEGRAMSKHAICLSTGRSKGGISGERSEANAEWLSGFGLGKQPAVDQHIELSIPTT